MPAAWMSVGGTSPFTASLPHSHIPLLFSVILALLVPAVQPLLNYGCTLSEDLCEEGEVCANDGLFGQCYAPDSGLPAPSVLGDLDDTQLELLRLELTRLVRDDLDWQDARSQCVIAYFKLSTSYDLQYDPDFCAVRNPANIWALVQLIEIGLNGDDEGAETANVGELIERLADAEPSRDEVEGEETELEDDDETPTSGDPVVEAKIREILADSDSNVDFSELSDAQLNELIARIYRIKNAIREADATGELEEAVPLDALTPEQAQLILKKDAEELGNTDNGLEGKEHKIVKGRETPAVSRVIGNRIYLKVNISDEEQLYPLIDFLQNTIALPNNLLFDDFQYDKGQLSLRISRAIGGAATLKKGGEKRIDSVESVAQAVYKRRKDIQRFSGAKVAETGIGMGEESVPVESEERDWIVQPVLFICAFTIAALVTVLAVHAARTYRRRRPSNPSDLPHLVEQVETKSSRAYEDLCRQRMSQEPAPQSAHGSKSSSTSSWCGDETAAGPSLDISTGHVLLKFLQDFIDEPARISEQWDTVKDYENITKSRNVAAAHPDSERLVDPYDESLVSVTDAGENAFLNASLLYDDAPRQPLYVAAESPRAGQAAAFWHAVWDQSVVLIVNLNTAAEVKEQRAYWPSSGSEVHGAFEIHLVSEHIWSEDYVVRSFYLKNLRNSQTRTVTQFHFLSWPKDGVPASAAALLEFRRKVNKSYRGRGSPLLVESASGAGRVGTFILLDVAVSRIQRGVKQIDLAASLEHLRDQRPGLVRTLDQYKLVFACVAQEVSQLVKALPQ